jgi:metallo-beta-lactamase class B
MKTLTFLVVTLSPVLIHSQTAAPLRPDPPISCSDCAAWNERQEPFRIFGNTYYVGVAGLSAILIVSDEGLILLEGGLPQSAPLIDENIRTLGFKPSDVRLILNSHAHYDHAGGIAALKRATGATVVASAAGAQALERGEPTADDPQFAFGRDANAFPPVVNVRRVADREIVRLGPLAVTAHLTPGHTPGSTAWTWQSCEGSTCVNVVYGDSLTPVAAPGFRFTGDDKHPSRVDSFRRSITRIAELPCDILLTPHPAASSLDQRRERQRQSGDRSAFIDKNACRAYAATAMKQLDQRIASEKAQKRP